MKTLIAATLAGTFTLALATASHAAPPQIPTPVNPFPINAVATDGTPLPSQSSAALGGDIYTGRSAAVGTPFNFVGNVVGAGLGAAGNVVGAGVGVVDGGFNGGYGVR